MGQFARGRALAFQQRPAKDRSFARSAPNDGRPISIIGSNSAGPPSNAPHAFGQPKEMVCEWRLTMMMMMMTAVVVVSVGQRWLSLVPLASAVEALCWPALANGERRTATAVGALATATATTSTSTAQLTDQESRERRAHSIAASCRPAQRSATRRAFAGSNGDDVRARGRKRDFRLNSNPLMTLAQVPLGLDNKRQQQQQQQRQTLGSTVSISLGAAALSSFAALKSHLAAGTTKARLSTAAES